MQSKRILLTTAAILLFTATAHAAELTGTAVFYWSYTPTNLGGDASGAFSIGRAIGPDVATDGTVLAVECVSATTPAGTNGGCVTHAGAEDSFRIIFECKMPLDPLPAGALGGCAGTATAVDGTGKFANIKGGNTHTLVINGFLSDGTLVGTTTQDRNFTY